MEVASVAPSPTQIKLSPAAESVKASGLVKQAYYDSLAKLPDIKVVPLEREAMYNISGPSGRKDESLGIPGYAHASCISTYPKNPLSQKGERYGDPNADHFGIRIFKNRTIICVTDGCGWGTKAALASRRANVAFVSHVHRAMTESEANSLSQLANVLLDAILEAHAAAILVPLESRGMTTLLGGLLVCVDQQQKKWGYLCVSVGDCKAFVYRNRTMFDVTAENRGNANNPTDPGGAIGPVDGENPDLRNLRVYWFDCEENDLLLAVSDGVHDTFDPEQLGNVPADFGITSRKTKTDTESPSPSSSSLSSKDDEKSSEAKEREKEKLSSPASSSSSSSDAWNALPDAERVKTELRCRIMQQAMPVAKYEKSPPDPQLISETITQFCFDTTKSSREFMETNPNKRQPNDKKLFPGKMDHTTCVAVLAAQPPKRDAEYLDPMASYPLPGARVLVSGASGFVGRALVPFLRMYGFEVACLVRNETSPEDRLSISWSPKSGKIDRRKLEHFEPHIVIHLSGENVMTLWTEAKRAEIRASRIESTALLVSQLGTLAQPPALFLCASGVGYYGPDRGAEWLDESASLGSGFLATICRDWEAEATRLAHWCPQVGIDAVIMTKNDVIIMRNEQETRVIQMRFGVVLDASGGALATMVGPFKLGLGGVVGSGNQYMPWISLKDVLEIVKHLILRKDLSGAVNFCAPQPVTNTVFTKTLGSILWRPTFFWMPQFVAKLAGDMANDTLLASIRATPKKLLETGFKFTHTDLLATLTELLAPNCPPAYAPPPNFSISGNTNSEPSGVPNKENVISAIGDSILRMEKYLTLPESLHSQVKELFANEMMTATAVRDLIDYVNSKAKSVYSFERIPDSELSQLPSEVPTELPQQSMDYFRFQFEEKEKRMLCVVVITDAAPQVHCYVKKD